MARLVPKIDPNQISLKPERDVAIALINQLGDDCTVYHSYPWIKLERDHYGGSFLREGEADFVVIAPTHGILILEVKGGTIAYHPEDRLWYRHLLSGEKKLIKDPFEQARSNAHYLARRINEAGVDLTYGYAVVFPDCVYEGPVPPGADKSIIFAANDLPAIDRRIKSALDNWCRGKKKAVISKSDIAVIRAAVSPSFQLLPALFRQLDDQEETIVRLTDEQARILDVLESQKRAAIKGVAGSGKTMLAVSQAQRFADRGARTLLVCYNRTLAAWLDTSLGAPLRERITIRHFHGLCRDFCNQAKMAFLPPAEGQEEFWREQAPDLFLEAIERVPDRFDAVVVDEGQDFFSNWWLPLEEINVRGDKGHLFVFFDPAQALYVGQEATLPNLGEPYNLKYNCRNTIKIAETCGQILGADILTHPAAPKGVQVIKRTGDIPEKRAAAVLAMVQEWRRGGIKPSSIVLLSPKKKENSCLSRIASIGGVAITSDIDEWRRNRGILFSTVRSFKGLEANAAILFDVPANGSSSHFSTFDFYVAASRAKHLLCIVSRG